MLFLSRIYEFFRGICPGPNFVATCSGRNFMGDSCPGLVFCVELFREKYNEDEGWTEGAITMEGI